ncbi:hypothetical protein [Dyadobacter sp.]|uniref:hypothetical protein n=1 Tax=Dyadobacter sp. TaxID=1914288 RepID=UPI003F6F492A
MKNIVLLLLLFFISTSCKKNREPDLAGKFVGEYDGSKKDSTVNRTETWKITRQDLNHVNVVFFFTNTYPDGSVIRSKEDINISNVTVSDNNVLNFNNSFFADQLEYKITGKAILTNNTLDYDLTIKVNTILQN